MRMSSVAVSTTTPVEDQEMEIGADDCPERNTTRQKESEKGEWFHTCQGCSKRDTTCSNGVAQSQTFSLVARSWGGNVASSSLTELSTSEKVRLLAYGLISARWSCLSMSREILSLGSWLDCLNDARSRGMLMVGCCGGVMAGDA